ncbi:MAG TPA: hypothetical protein VFX92_09775 [Candidatus Krumholzibacteria bacterium]|nr:hypothetical protein [Candidatus Krumholzibacteria bacterium]
MTRVARMAVAAALVAGVFGTPIRARAESIFGINLLGEHVDTGDARMIGLGGFVQLVDDSLGVLQYNPATTAWVKRVTFGVAGYVSSDANKSADFEEKTISTKITGLTFAFPLFRNTLSASFGFRGRYDPDGTFAVPMTTSEGDAYENRFERSGGLWTVPMTLALDGGRFGKIGGFYTLDRGSIEDKWIIDFTGPATADAVSTQNREFSASSWGVGAVVRPLRRVSLGLMYEAAVDYDVQVDESYTNSGANTRYNESMTLPARWTGSATLRPGGGFVVHAGASVSDFEKFDGVSFPAGRLAREETVALGMEYRRHGQRLPLRAAARYEQLPYTLPEGENIQRRSLALGTGLLFRDRRGRMDIALQFGQTGSVNTNTYEDRFVRFFVSITGSEEWKRQRETRY